MIWNYLRLPLKLLAIALLLWLVASFLGALRDLLMVMSSRRGSNAMVAANCPRCGHKPRNPAAKFCSYCGERIAFTQAPASTAVASRVSRSAPFPVDDDDQRPTTGWRSIPAPVRFAVWLVVIPILLGFASCTLLWLGALSMATK
jgi:hypothetical protein